MDLLEFKEQKSYLRPLFWQHGEKAEVLIEEIKQMHENGVGGFIVEARPHPDFLSYGWWRDLDVIIAEAKKREMEVWIFDDSSYPSGIGAGKIKELYPEYTKTFMAQHHIDVVGPRKNATINVKAWVEASQAEGVHNLSNQVCEELICVLLAKRKNGGESLQVETIRDLTHKICDGRIEIDLEEGSWRVFIITKTKTGGEEWTKDYVDPLSRKAVSKYIDIIYEEHYKRYSDEFGNTIKGFFSDEPRFGNIAGYENIMWKPGVVYPYVDGLLDKLSYELGEDFTKYLPFLWSDEDEICHDIHFCYMNVVSQLFADNFTGQIGDWCRNHKVKFIGHVVEDNGAHARLGYGSGHFFRVMEGMDSAGMDLVYQVWPNHTEGRFTTPFGYLDAEFFYWGISKMTSSAAHIDEKKNGIALCEIFGAYGWQMGLKFMKWLTDHVAVRGINLLVPHAFSPKYPDDDCPPHFYANGYNPQWEYFHIWSSYTNRVCDLLTDGLHHATAAVVYHAEAEWGGNYEPFEKVVRVLAQDQIDSDVVPIDYLIDSSRCQVVDGKLWINKESYEVLVIPYTQCISKVFIDKLLEFSKLELPIVFMTGYPDKVYYYDEINYHVSLDASDIEVCDYESLVPYLKSHGIYDIELEDHDEYLRVYHYLKNDKEIYFLTNEDPNCVHSNTITLPRAGHWLAYDAMEDKVYALDKVSDKSNTYRIEMSPYQSLFIINEDRNLKTEFKAIPCNAEGREICLDENWQVSIKVEDQMEVINGLTTLKNIASHELYPKYSGLILYEQSFNIEAVDSDSRVYLYLGDVYEIAKVIINGVELASKIAPPYNYDVSDYLEKNNRIRVEVINTLAKEKGDNYFDRSMLQEPSGLLGPVKLVISE